jgi:hypothetical protein
MKVSELIEALKMFPKDADVSLLENMVQVDRERMLGVIYHNGKVTLFPDPNYVLVKRFNDTTGTHGYISSKGPTGANFHPDRCICQGNDPTPHKHSLEPPYSCARCVECKAYIQH